MRIVYDDESVRWFREASDFTGYGRGMAELLLARMPARGSVCDMGCGAGLVDMELALHVGRITCVDIDPRAAASVAELARARGLANVEAVCADATTLAGEWDTVVALFHGGSAFVPGYLAKARDRLILATSAGHGGFSAAGRGRPTGYGPDAVAAHLEELGLAYAAERHSLEYGQPFRTYADAVRFVRTWSPEATDAELDAYLGGALQQTGREDFPLYLPKRREFVLFVIPRNQDGWSDRASSSMSTASAP
jgi:SAM-dependent methyltransferase